MTNSEGLPEKYGFIIINNSDCEVTVSPVGAVGSPLQVTIHPSPSAGEERKNPMFKESYADLANGSEIKPRVSLEECASWMRTLLPPTKLGEAIAKSAVKTILDHLKTKGVIFDVTD